jgi:hypothetical protein
MSGSGRRQPGLAQGRRKVRMPGQGLRQYKGGLTLGLALVSLACGTSQPEAAGSAYAVDTAEVGEVGNCKLESWLSWADNRDFIASMTPACVVDFGHPVDMSAQVSRSRADGEWTSTVSPKLKANIVPTSIGRFGFAVSATTTVDTISREATAFMVTVPATLRLSERMRLNLNAGWMLDRILDAHFFTYGAGLDWIVHGPWIVTAEVFGQTARGDFGTIVKPRWQTGLRFRPVDAFSVDLIYGRNITGENANWLTLAATARFSPGER